jgi:hypothetical protein
MAKTQTAPASKPRRPRKTPQAAHRQATAKTAKAAEITPLNVPAREESRPAIRRKAAAQTKPAAPRRERRRRGLFGAVFSWLFGRPTRS